MFHLPFYNFPSFLFHSPLSLFPGRSTKISRPEVTGALCPPPACVTPLPDNAHTNKQRQLLIRNRSKTMKSTYNFHFLSETDLTQGNLPLIFTHSRMDSRAQEFHSPRMPYSIFYKLRLVGKTLRRKGTVENTFTNNN